MYKPPIDYMRRVYWAEKDLTGWTVKDGYILAEYRQLGVTYFVVTLGDITSCVVRHINTYSRNEREAWATIADIKGERK